MRISQPVTKRVALVILTLVPSGIALYFATLPLYEHIAPEAGMIIGLALCAPAAIFIGMLTILVNAPGSKQQSTTENRPDIALGQTDHSAQENST
jgi:hypothetical protein